MQHHGEAITYAQAHKIVKTIIDEIITGMRRGKTVHILDFGFFIPRQRKAWIATDRISGEKIAVPEKRMIHFKAGKGLKEALNSQNG